MIYQNNLQKLGICKDTIEIESYQRLSEIKFSTVCQSDICRVSLARVRLVRLPASLPRVSVRVRLSDPEPLLRPLPLLAAGGDGPGPVWRGEGPGPGATLRCEVWPGL